jgi:hypothetical protein
MAIGTIGYPEIQKSPLSEFDFGQQFKANRLANQIKEIQAKYAEQMQQEALKKAQLENQYPGIHGTGIGANIAQLQRLKDLHRDEENQPGALQTENTKANLSTLGNDIATNMTNLPHSNTITSKNDIEEIGNKLKLSLPKGQDDLVDLFKDSLYADLQKKVLTNKWLDLKMKKSGFETMPQAQKNQVLSRADGMGYTYDEANRLLINGKSLRDLAVAKGYRADGTDWPSPNYPITTGMLTQQQKANVAKAALDAVEPQTVKMTAPYAKRVAGGISPELIKDIVFDSNKDKASDALAGIAMQSAIQMSRGRIEAGPMGITALNKMIQTNLAGWNLMGFSPGSEIYTLTQKKIQKLLNKMNVAENRAMNNQLDEDLAAEDRKQDAADKAHGMSDEDIDKLIGEGNE